MTDDFTAQAREIMQKLVSSNYIGDGTDDNIQIQAAVDDANKEGNAPIVVSSIDGAIESLLALHQAELERTRRAAYDGGYDDCLREHGAVFKEKEAKL